MNEHIPVIPDTKAGRVRIKLEAQPWIVTGPLGSSILEQRIKTARKKFATWNVETNAHQLSELVHPAPHHIYLSHAPIDHPLTLSVAVGEVLPQERNKYNIFSISLTTSFAPLKSQKEARPRQWYEAMLTWLTPLAFRYAMLETTQIHLLDYADGRLYVTTGKDVTSVLDSAFPCETKHISKQRSES